MTRPEYVEFLGDTLDNATRVSRDGAVHFVCCDWRHVTEIMDERVNELDDAAHRAEQGDLQHVGVVEIEHALVLIFGEQRIEHGAGLAAEFGEHVAFLDVLGPLAARQWGAIEGHMADEIEGIEVFAKFLGDGIERQALGLQLLDDRLLALGTFPAL